MNKHITSSSTGLRNVCPFAAKTRSKVANITPRGELGVMCLRYEVYMTTPYNMTFACMGCRKSFKREFNLAKECPPELVCPNCGGTSYNFGRHFKSPKKTDSKQWKKVEFLFEHGFRFQKIRIGSGHHDVVPYPETLEQAKEFVIKYKKYSLNEE